MTQGLKSVVPLIALIAVLAMAPVAPEAGNTLFLVAGAVGLLLMWPEAMAEVRRPIVWMPLTGLVAWIGASGVSATFHEIGRLILIALIGLHIFGALVEQFVFRHETLQRMLASGT